MKLFARLWAVIRVGFVKIREKGTQRERKRELEKLGPLKHINRSSKTTFQSHAWSRQA